MTSIVTTIAAVIGWAAAVVVFIQAGALLGVPALAGWSVSAALGMDMAWHRERMPAGITALLVAAAAVFAVVAVSAI
jgi:hypothetical protein